MATAVGSFAIGSTGNLTISSLPFTPTAIEFTISADTSGAENTIAHFSTGRTDGTNSSSESILVTSALTLTRRSNSYCLTHYNITSGSSYRTISATFVSFGTNSFTLNFDRANVNFSIDFVIHG